VDCPSGHGACSASMDRPYHFENMSCTPSRAWFGLSYLGKTHCLSGASPFGYVVFVCSEKQVSNNLRKLSCVTSVPHTGSCSTHTRLLHFPGGTCWGVFFCSQDCQKDLSTSHVLFCASGRPSLSLTEHPCIVHSIGKAGILAI